jgi:WD40 repeat protein
MVLNLYNILIEIISKFTKVNNNNMKLYSLDRWVTIFVLIFKVFVVQGQVPELLLPIGHSNYIRDASYSPDGKRIATASGDRTVKIWNAENGRLLLTIDGFTDFTNLSYIKFSPDNKSIATISEDQSVRIWDSNSGKMFYKFDQRVNDASRVEYSPDGKYLLLIQDSIIDMWDIQARKLIFTPVQSFVFSPDRKTILTSLDGITRIWNAFNNNLIRILDERREYNDLSGGLFSPDGKNFMIVSGYEVKVSDTDTGNLLFTIYSDSESLPCYSPDGKKILSVGNLFERNGKWKKRSEVSLSFDVDSGGLWGPIPGLYDATNGKLLKTYIDSATIDTQREYVGNNVPFYKIGFSPDNKNIYIVSDKCRIWDAEHGIQLFSISGQFDNYTSVTYTPDCKRILVISSDSCGLYDASNGSLLHKYDKPNFRIFNRLESNEYIVSTASLSPNGRYFYIISLNKSLKICDASTGELRMDLAGHSTPVSEAVFSADGKNILAKSLFNNNATKLWDLINGKILNSFKGTEWETAKYSNNGSAINTYTKSGSENTIIKTWDALTGKLLDTVELQADSVINCVFSPDNKTVVAIDSNYTAKILDAITGKELHRLTGSIGNIKYSPDSKTLAATSWFDFINIWDVESGRLIHTFRDSEENGDTVGYQITDIDSLGNLIPKNVFATPDIPFEKLPVDAKMWVTGNIKNVEFSANGKTLIDPEDWSFSERVWDVQSDSLLNRFSGNRAAINPDGTRILTFDSVDEGISPVISETKTGKKLFNLEEDILQMGSARFSPDGKNILTIRHDSVKFWNAENGLLKRAIYFSGTFCDIDEKSEKIIVHNNSQLVLFDIRTGEKLYSLIAIDSADYLVLTPDKYYMCSKNAASKLSWLVGDRLYSFDQFDLQYNRPDIVLERLGNPDTSLIKMYRKAYEKRLRKAGFNEVMFSSEWHTPEMKILNSDILNSPTDQSILHLEICGSDSKYYLNRLQVWVNDVPLYGSNGLSLLEEKTDSIVKMIDVNLSTGDNNIKVSCVNEKGVESLKESADIVYNPQKPAKPDLYIVAMSVSDYKDKRFDLRYAAKDGNDVVSMFRSLANPEGDFGKVFIDTLFNKRAIRKNFFNLKQRLSASKVDDEVVVYVSGHGLLDKEMDFYFATYDIDFRNPEKRGISFDDLEGILDGIPARKKLLMMDACHSGEVDKEETNDMLASNTEKSSDITFRGNVKEYNFKGIDSKTTQSGISLNNSFELMQELFAGLDQGTGATVISAAAGKGYALESPQWNNGVFTYSILNGLKNKAADKNKNGVITVSELKDYSIKQVQFLTGGKQKPTIRKESVNFDWKIW